MSAESEYEREKLRIMGEAADVLGRRTPESTIKTFGGATDEELHALVADEERSPGAAATARAVLSQRAMAFAILSELPEGTPENDRADALMGNLGVSEGRALAYLDLFDGRHRQALWISSRGVVSCPEHGGEYLRQAVEREPHAVRIITALDDWMLLEPEAVKAHGCDPATFVCEGCQS